MADWQRELDIKEAGKSTVDGSMSIEDLAGIISQKLRSLRAFNDPAIDDAKDEIADWFDCIAEGGDSDAFDDVMAELYDWADTHISGGFFNAKKVCWVKII